jgi:Rrf2 family iron-sulfur cluster assembly transcriptional regulator
VVHAERKDGRLSGFVLQDLVDQQRQKNAEQSVMVMHRNHAALG